VRVVSKYYVIHGPVAEPPGRAVCAAARQGQAKYVAFEAAVWASLWPGGAGSPPVKEHAAEEELIKVAKATGLDVARFRADLTGAACAAWMERTSDVLSRFGVPGTPSFYVNGRIVDGGGEALEQAVTEAIAEVTRSGVAPARYYQDVVMKTGEPHARTVSSFD
jgi:predicted DsbA family dithiol-disulfide isomerase